MFTKARIFIVLVAAASLFFIAREAFALDVSEYALALVLLSVACFLTQIYEIELIPHFTFSTHIAVVVAGIYIGGLPLSLWVVVLATLPAEVLLRQPKRRSGRSDFFDVVVFNVSQLALSAAAASFVLSYTGQFRTVFQTEYPEMVAAFLAYMLVNFALVAGIVSLSSEERFFAVMRFGIKKLPLQFITMGVIAILMYTLYEEAPYNLALALVPLALVHYSIRSYLRLRQDSHEAFRRITDLLDQRDQYTGEHSDNVEALAKRLGEAVGLEDEQLEAVCSGAAIHDIGKIAIPDAILHKRGPLTDEEFETMKTHTTIGANIIQNLDIYKNVVPIVRHEHEHWDGSGYPDGLAGEDIPILARIVAVADVYSALTTERPYRVAMGKPLAYSPEEGCSILRDMAGSVLDPNLVELFVRELGPSYWEEMETS